MGLAGAALLGAFTTAIGGTAEHRSFATLDTTLQSFAEKATNAIQLEPVNATGTTPLYSHCATVSGTANATGPTYISYANQLGTVSTPIRYTPPTNVTVTATIYYWTGTGFSTLCPVSAAAAILTGPQEIVATATSGGVGRNAVTDSLTFVVSDPLVIQSVPTQIVFVQEPLGVSSNTPLTQQPIVALEDAQGHVVVTDQSTVTAVINSGPSNGQLQGCTQNEYAGFVTFANCQVSKDGTYSLIMSDGAMAPAISNTFTTG